ncbi:MerR family transcriptional regulator [Enterococcus faecalis]|uniref:HTH merR-type domain-containing protein n=1 Tax=Enterococcus faecalis ATCC 6055 TaxID=1169311 RepID=R3HEY5_ENTFL|nr:MerR family transcriptional regulator [Enterococcus faecalis]EOK04043.1 hypothetical protein WOU_03225 [Enterococcus faecalis ATCC 6055]
MRLLTTGELASLFSISKYTIRHYIDIGLLVPKQRKENGYYLFDEDNIYKLYQVLVLKNIGYPLSTIDTILCQNGIVDYFIDAEQQLQNKIDELNAIKKTVKSIIQAQDIYKLNETTFFERPDRYFKSIPKSVLKNETIDLLKASDLNISPLDEIFYITKKNLSNIPCLKSEKKDNEYFFSQGTYACKSFVVKNEECIKKNVAFFLTDKLLNINGANHNDLLLYENVYCSLAYSNVTVFSLEVKL